MKDDQENRFVWKEDTVDCPLCCQYFTLGFETYDDDENFRNFLQSGKQFEYLETLDCYLTKPHFTLWFLMIGSKFVRGGELYRCKGCNQNWAYSEADLAWRGYFRPVAAIKPKMPEA